ncbi:MAG: hypothetical protein RR800_13855, partial [Comamonas sp.]
IFSKTKMACIELPANEKWMCYACNQGHRSRNKGRNQHQIELPHPHQSLLHKLIVINVIAVTTIAAAEIEAASSEIFREVNHPASSKCRSADPSM